MQTKSERIRLRLHISVYSMLRDYGERFHKSPGKICYCIVAERLLHIEQDTLFINHLTEAFLPTRDPTTRTASPQLQVCFEKELFEKLTRLKEAEHLSYQQLVTSILLDFFSENGKIET